MESNTRINRQLHNVQQAADIFTISGSESEGNGSNFHQRRFVRDTTQLQGYTETDSSSQASVELVADVFTTTASEIDSDDDERQTHTGEIFRVSADESSMTNVVLAADSFTTTESEGELDVSRRPPHLSAHYAADDDVANLSRSARVSYVAVKLMNSIKHTPKAMLQHLQVIPKILLTPISPLQMKMMSPLEMKAFNRWRKVQYFPIRVVKETQVQNSFMTNKTRQSSHKQQARLKVT